MFSPLIEVLYMDLIAGFDYSSFNRALFEILYRGEFCPDKLEHYPDFNVKLSHSGKAFKGLYIRHYLPQVSSTILKNIYKQVVRGSGISRRQASLLYRCGLGVPKDLVISALWAHMPHRGRVELPDGSIIDFKDLKSVFKEHLKAAFRRNGQDIYFSEYVDYYSNIRKYIKPDLTEEKTKAKPKHQIALCGSEADVFVTYVESSHNMKLAGVVLFIGSKMYDITYQALSEKVVSPSIPSMYAGTTGKRVTFVGKFNTKDGSDVDINTTVNDFIDNAFIVESQTKREQEVRSKLRVLDAQPHIRNAQSIYLKITQIPKAKRTNKERKALDKITSVLQKHKKETSSLRKEHAKIRDNKNNLPGKVLEFLAYDVLMPSTTTTPFSTGLSYKVVRGKYERVLDNIKSLDIKTMHIVQDNRKPRNCKNFLGIASRYQNTNATFWELK